MSALLLYLLFFLQIVDPAYPPQAMAGGTVVAKLHFAEGKVKSLKILSGEEPFTDSTRSALSDWKIPAKKDGDEIAIVHFCHPFLHRVGKGMEAMSPVKPDPFLPYPRKVVPPPYPPNALAQGSVVLLAKISAEGRVLDAEVLQSVGSMTESSVDAVRKWEFVVPEASKGTGRESRAYIVFVYRYPISTQ